MSEYDHIDDARELEREALVLIQREWAGDLAAEETDAVARWCARSPEHEQAFASATRLHAALLGVINGGSSAKVVTPRTWERRPAPPQAWGRRAFLGGAIAASGAYLMVRPPANLWPSLTELTADYHTRTGGRRQVAVSSNVDLDLNTQTSVALRHGAGPGVELVSGELAATVRAGGQAPFVIAAAGGNVVAAAAQVDVRLAQDAVCVTCLEGSVQIQHPTRSVQLPAGRQVIYGRRDVGPVTVADTQVATAWRRGVLVFHHTPLRQVLEEVNRYRPGRLILANAGLARLPILGVFEINRIDLVVDQIRQLSGARVTELPGQIVVFT